MIPELINLFDRVTELNKGKTNIEVRGFTFEPRFSCNLVPSSLWDCKCFVRFDGITVKLTNLPANFITSTTTVVTIGLTQFEAIKNEYTCHPYHTGFHMMDVDTLHDHYKRIKFIDAVLADLD